MGGNLMGTWLFQKSNQLTGVERVGWFGNGTLPFVAVAGVLALASIFLWVLEWEESQSHMLETPLEYFSEEIGNIELERKDEKSSGPLHQQCGSSLDTQQQDKSIYSLMQLDTTYEMKLD